MFQFIITTTLMLILFTTISGVVRIPHNFVIFQFLSDLGSELHRKQVVLIFVLLLKLNFEQTGITLHPQSRKQALSVIANKDILTQQNHIKISIKMGPKRRIKRLFCDLIDVFMFDCLVVTRREQNDQLRAKFL